MVRLLEIIGCQVSVHRRGLLGGQKKIGTSQLIN